ncbi:mechanosensitive ion channel family protein [Halalkalibacter akibai]|uniref:MscS Mechanosensitive ion channel n=1 Tax=Halalkalibacter akibai (strain ATCC 43226 / DSM 21942 / CIP 109018 / JCM 9157 / 1139) TaxID=1236973 RepID=W4QQ09_HALA3|nr:mechanosensitive ion channel family protein [Halalkalibacter akibai]GAE33992.1 MscS Mechanosensitive ion channel [Halalkalibacter akibai JCM 9157]
MISSLNEHVLFILKTISVGALIFLTLILLKRWLRWFFKEFDFSTESKEKTTEVFLNSFLNYAAIVGFIVYVLTPYIDLTKVLMGAGIVALILGATLQKFIKDAFFGFIRLYEKQFIVGDFVIINGKHQGTIEEIRVRFIRIREWSGRRLMLAHSEILEIQNYNHSELKVIEKIVIDNQENPEKVKVVIENVCEKLNTEIKEWLQVDQSGNSVQPFEVYGITSLNRDYVGIEWTVIGVVKPEHYIKVCNLIRYELAVAVYKEKIRLAANTVVSRS